jgi:gliding motility-associated-like protein
MKLFRIIVLFFLALYAQPSNAGQWQWVKGDSTQFTLGNYGVKYLSSPNNNPPARYAAAHWKDLQGNFWLYGGDMHDDLWKFDPISSEWTWMGGSTVLNQAPVYGTLGVPSTLNSPGALQLTNATWVDNNGDFWMLGGINQALYKSNTLWRYHIATNEWTWMAGTNFSQNASFGPPGIFSTNYTPQGITEDNVTWVDNQNNLWLYVSGSSDLWEFDVVTKQWAWIKGNHGNATAGVYGPMKQWSANNIPPSGVAYCGGLKNVKGWLEILIPNPGNGFSNELWAYDVLQQMWSLRSRTAGTSGAYLHHCLPDYIDFPKKNVDYRSTPAYCPNTYWFYGGDFPGNDLWLFNANSGSWNWIDGSLGQSAIFGSKGVNSNYNRPPGGTGNCMWTDNNNMLWVFGVNKTNSLWKYSYDPNCTAPSCITDSIVYLSYCPTDSVWIPSQWIKTEGVYSTSQIVNGVTQNIVYMVSQTPLNIRYVTKIYDCHKIQLWPNGDTVKAPGVLSFHYTAANGCDSAVVITFQIPEVFVQACAQPPHVLPNGSITSTPGYYTNNISTLTQPICDSIIVHTSIYAMPKVDFYCPDTVCIGRPITFNDFIVPDTSIPNASINMISEQWSFGDTASISINPNNPNAASTHGYGLHTYFVKGTYQVKLIVMNPAGCYDTLIKKLVVSRKAKPLQLAVSKDSVCIPYDTTTVYLKSTIKANWTYYWDINGAQLIKGNVSSSKPIVVSWFVAGDHPIIFHSIPPPTDTSCPSTDTIIIHTKGINPDVHIIGRDVICPNTIDTLYAAALSSKCGPSNNGCLNPQTYILGAYKPQLVAWQNTSLTPLITNSKRGRIQYLYSATDLNNLGMNGACTISDLAWQVLTKSSTTPIQNLNIKMACVSYAAFSVSPIFDTITTLTTVYSNSSYSTVLGMNKFILQTPYNWDGTSNLLIDVCFENGNTTSTNDVIASYAGLVCRYNLTNSSVPNGACNLVSASGNTNATPYLHLGVCRNIGNAPNGTVFNWTSSLPNFQASNSPIYVTPTHTTTYYVQAYNGVCTGTDSFVVYHPKINNAILLPADTAICRGNLLNTNSFLLSSQSNALHQINSGVNCSLTSPCPKSDFSVEVGNGTLLTGPTSPFYGIIENHKITMRYRAKELRQSGLHACRIDSLGFFITNKMTNMPFGNFTIKMQCGDPLSPSMSNFPGGNILAYYPSLITKTGWNMLGLTNAFVWDGVSDILIETCYNSSIFQSGTDEVRKSLYPEVRSIYGYSNNPMAVPGCNIFQWVFNASYYYTHELPDIKLAVCDADSSQSIPFIHSWTSAPIDTSIIGVTGASIAIHPTTSTTYIVNLLNAAGCPATDTFNLIILEPSLPDTANTHLCATQVFNCGHGHIITKAGFHSDTLRNKAGCDSIHVTNIIHSISSFDTLHLFSCNHKSLVLPNGQLVTQSGIYRDTLTNQFLCDSFVLYDVTILEVKDTLIKASICAGELYTLPNGRQVWLEGDYQDTLQSFNGCDSAIHTHLRISQKPFVDLGPDTFICLQQSIRLMVRDSIATMIHWSDGSTNASYLVRSPGIYQVTVSNPPCVDASDRIEIKQYDCQCDLVIANAFTPNEDGLDDRFFPIIHCDLPYDNFVFRIFNRWGECVFYTSDPMNIGWDGAYKGRQQPISTFVYELIYTDPFTHLSQFKKGNVELIR